MHIINVRKRSAAPRSAVVGVLAWACSGDTARDASDARSSFVAGQGGAGFVEGRGSTEGGASGDGGGSPGDATVPQRSPVIDAAVAADAELDASVDGARADSAPSDPPGQQKAIIGVGYGGIRLVSTDQGATWHHRASFAADGGDDENLLRAVVYGRGLWIATGWKLVTSTDGREWIDRGMLTNLPEPRPACNIIEGLAFKDGVFYAACTLYTGQGTVYRSNDGLGWTKLSEIGSTGGHLFLTYRGGQFVAHGDSKASFQSTDATTWLPLGVEQATYCDAQWKPQSVCGDASWFEGGISLKPEWKGKIMRSVDGAKAVQVYLDDQGNTIYRGRAFAEGYVAR
ncbi:MAG TPA: hypothetical protein VJT73_00080 [Polyangiaceae bacterium]|nr:hypothetical protein [Polyangiaceae bacterium]